MSHCCHRAHPDGGPAPRTPARARRALGASDRLVSLAMLISAEGCAVLLVDIQQRLVAALDGGGKEMVDNAARLAAAAVLLDVPVCATEQAPDKLGPTLAELQP